MRHCFKTLSLAVVLGGLTAVPAAAQDARMHFPLDHRAPVGVAGQWNVIAQRGIFGFPQPIEVSLPSAGRVTFFDGSTPEGVSVAAPAQARLAVGRVCRVKISDLPEFPGVELYPTIELLDRLHAPPEMASEFAVPIQLTLEEIEAVLQDRMVTKVVYLERQDLPRPHPHEDAVQVSDLLPSANLLESATLRGRPIAILRLGGRTPVPGAPDDLAHPFAPVEVIHSPSAQP